MTPIPHSFHSIRSISSMVSIFSHHHNGARPRVRRSPKGEDA